MFRGENLSGEAFETLSILLADLTTLLMGAIGEAAHPGLLIHDSPREADLGGNIYRRLLLCIAQVADELGEDSSTPFQYIVTTTTPPPTQLKKKKTMRLKLGGEEGMLFNQQLHVGSELTQQDLPRLTSQLLMRRRSMNENERPMTECYVAFLDLLGVRKLADKAAKNSTLCEGIVSALKETKNTSSFIHGTRNIETGELKEWSLQVQAFSDCVVLFIPTETEMLPWLLASVRRLHDRLLRLNVPVRGGITVGAMHWDMAWDKETGGNTTDSAPVAFGPGLVAAYDLEDDAAIYPRILISSGLYDHVDEQTKLKNKVFPLADSGKLLDYLSSGFRRSLPFGCASR